MNFQYPAVGFHFAVVFELFPQTPNDLRFQEVGGLSVTVDTKPFPEGGENRFEQKLPTRAKYSDLTLKRGMFAGSGILKWCKSAIEDFVFQPTNITITLLNDKHIPIAGWYVVNAYPIAWSVSDLNAKEGSVMIETIKLNYNYFKILSV